MKPSAPELGSLDRRVPSDKPVRLAWFDERGQIRCVTGRCIDVSSRCGFELILPSRQGTQYFWLWFLKLKWPWLRLFFTTSMDSSVRTVIFVPSKIFVIRSPSGPTPCFTKSATYHLSGPFRVLTSLLRKAVAGFLFRQYKCSQPIHERRSPYRRRQGFRIECGTNRVRRWCIAHRLGSGRSQFPSSQ